LAIMMLLAATESYRWERERRAALASVTPNSGPDPEPKPEAEPDPQPAPVAEPAPEPPALGSKPDSEVEYQILDDVSEPDYPEPTSPEPVQGTNKDHDTDDDGEDEPSVIRQCKRLWKQDNPGNTLKEQRRLVAAGQLDHEPWLDYLDDPRLSREVGFGEILPTRAFKGDMFVMTSVAPTALFKFNGEKWITIDKEFTDQYAHNEAYINYLIEQIGRGAYDPDLLSEAERAQIAQRLQQEI